MLPYDLHVVCSVTSFRWLPKWPPQRDFFSSLCLKYHPLLHSLVSCPSWFSLHCSFTTYNDIYFIIVSLLHHRDLVFFFSLNIPELVHCLAHDRCSINTFERINESGSLDPLPFWSPCFGTWWGGGLGFTWLSCLHSRAAPGLLPLPMASSSSKRVSPSPMMLAPSRSFWTWSPLSFAAFPTSWCRQTCECGGRSHFLLFFSILPSNVDQTFLKAQG